MRRNRLVATKTDRRVPCWSGGCVGRARALYDLAMRLRSAMLYVKDLGRMKRFYGEMLGHAPSHQVSTDGWATFNTGVVQLALNAIPAEIAQAIEIAVPPIGRESSAVKLVFEVDDVELERARLESLGIQTVRRSWQKPGEACDAVDPEGNI